MGRPPFDINIAGIAFSGGKFNDNRDNPPRETTRLLGTISIGPFDASMFVDFGKSPGSGFIDLVNAEKFQLINSLVVRAMAARGEASYKNHTLGANEAEKQGLAAAFAPGKDIVEDTLPLVATQTLIYTNGSGTPVLQLQLPNSTTLDETTNTVAQLFTRTVGVTEIDVVAPIPSCRSAPKH